MYEVRSKMDDVHHAAQGAFCAKEGEWTTEGSRREGLFTGEFSQKPINLGYLRCLLFKKSVPVWGSLGLVRMRIEEFQPGAM